MPRSHEAEGLIENMSDWVHIEFDVFQKTENEDECSDIEKREGSVGLMFQSPLEVDVPAIERIERRTDDLRRDAGSL
jgi:hypothetical protein